MHIKKVVLHRFKQFRDTTIDLRSSLSLVVGANNTGKSSLLQALGTWQFCKTLLEIEKGRIGWIQTRVKAGVGMGIADFTPMNIPSLKHLWTNLKTQKEGEPDGYTLKIGVFWDLADGSERHLEIGMSLANDRLFVKSTSTNLALGEILADDGVTPVEGNVPRVAYLPPFAGITDREGRHTPAMRERLLGQGLSGGVIRNVLFDLHESNKKARDSVRQPNERKSIKPADLALLRANDPWEILISTVRRTFGTDLVMVPFNERYHSYLKIECVKGTVAGSKFTKHADYNSRELMVEGSGFLQWLSVYALSLTPEVDVVLLDEPDAHLNAALQKEMVSDLRDISAARGKQVLMATHSPELIRFYEHDRILSIKGGAGRYLAAPEGRIAILAGIGTGHAPKLHALTESKRMLILEAQSDERFLKILAERANVPWPKDVVSWFWTGKASERLQLFKQLKTDIPELEAISIRDRDDETDGSCQASLVDKGFTTTHAGFQALKWRRRHIENYMLCPAAIARTAGKPVEEVIAFFAARHGMVIPADFTSTDVVIAMRHADGKGIMQQGDNSVRAVFGVKREDVARVMNRDEIAEDLITFFAALTALSAIPVPAAKRAPAAKKVAARPRRARAAQA